MDPKNRINEQPVSWLSFFIGERMLSLVGQHPFSAVVATAEIGENQQIPTTDQNADSLKIGAKVRESSDS